MVVGNQRPYAMTLNMSSNAMVCTITLVVMLASSLHQTMIGSTRKLLKLTLPLPYLRHPILMGG